MNGGELIVNERPWGTFRILDVNDYSQTKTITVYPGAQLSLQSHEKREEYWIVTHGNGIVQLNGEDIVIKAGSMVFIPKDSKHRLINTDEKESLLVIEVQQGEYFGEDDIVRYDDIYGRT